jgi:hypothetical protein
MIVKYLFTLAEPARLLLRCHPESVDSLPSRTAGPLGRRQFKVQELTHYGE